MQVTYILCHYLIERQVLINNSCIFSYWWKCTGHWEAYCKQSLNWCSHKWSKPIQTHNHIHHTTIQTHNHIHPTQYKHTLIYITTDKVLTALYNSLPGKHWLLINAYKNLIKINCFSLKVPHSVQQLTSIYKQKSLEICNLNA